MVVTECHSDYPKYLIIIIITRLVMRQAVRSPVNSRIRAVWMSIWLTNSLSLWHLLMEHPSFEQVALTVTSTRTLTRYFLSLGPLSLHTQTAIYFAEKMTSARFTVTPVEGSDSAFYIECVGAALFNKHL